ncbi:MAG: DUF4114 domain-containing protein, partial [Azoarcus sp.]|nr:DUF4114 domain-containing protein [Azoarcus sp.]
MSKKQLIASLLLIFGSMSVMAEPDAIKSGHLYIVDTSVPVEITFVNRFADYFSTLYVASYDASGNMVDGWQKLFTSNTELRSSVSKLFSGTELVFRLDVSKNGHSWYSNAKDADGFDHAWAQYDYWQENLAVVGFEDLVKGGDKDFNDMIFSVNNISRSPIPIPIP